jgi:hypothetical protein
MTDQTPAPVAAPTERGWGRVLLALALVLLLVGPVAPIGRPLVVLFPLLAALMLAGWRRGGRLVPTLGWTAAVIYQVVQLGSSASGLGRLELGFSLLLAAAFGILAGAWRDVPFFPRALGATAITIGGAALLAVSGGGIGRVTEAVERDYRARTTTMTQAATAMIAQQGRGDQSEVARERREAMRVLTDGLQQFLPVIGVALLPALLALEALAILAIAWALYHRLNRTRLGPPLGRLADFRFSDGLVWGIIAGLAILVVPGLAPLRGVAANLLVLFGTLYAIRGFGVLWYFVAPGPVVTVFVVLAASVFWTIVVPTAACLGLSDTWIDWRRRAQAPAP